MLMMIPNLKEEFDREMIRLYESAKSECNYNATYFLRMVRNRGGVETARHLVLYSGLAKGLKAMARCGRLDLTVEALVLRDPWKKLFTKEVISIAEIKLRTLQRLGYHFPMD